MKITRAVVVLLIAALVPALRGTPVRAIAGDLDPSFGGGDGIVTTNVGATDYVKDMALQPDGKILAAGYSGTTGTNDFVVARYGEDGTLDPTFGGGDGIVMTPILGDDQAQAIALQDDGNILVAGGTKAANSDFAVARYTSAGALDTTFGGDGIVTTPIFGGDDIAYDVAVQSDGRIVAVGSTASGTSLDFAVVRYNSDGSLDTSFDTDGIVSTNFDGRGDTAYGVQIQPDGKIVAGGWATVGGDSSFGFARYNTNGSLDTSFDGDGLASATIPIVAQDRAFDIALQSDGKIVGAGYIKGTLNDDFALVRFDADGSLDTTFGVGGFVTTDVLGTDQIAYSVAIQNDGKIVASGFSFDPAAVDDDFMITRYNPDGSLDTTLGLDGIVTTSIGSTDIAYAVAIQEDGKIVAGGYSAGDFALARYLGVSEVGSGVPSDFNGDGYGDLAVGVPGEDVGTATDTGAVNVLYGSATGLGATSNQFWDENATGIATDASGDVFGWALAQGDFNNDGFADLAIGVPGSQVGTVPGAGFVSVLYGSPAGLEANGAQAWTQDSTDIADSAEQDDNFGYSVATGDFNNDGFDDLAVGVPGEDVGSIVDAGAANVIYGSASGLTAAGNQFWNQDSTDINDKAEASDIFGFSVASGDFDGNGFQDLIAGVPLEDVGSVRDAGAASVIYGSAGGLTATGDQYWNENSTNILGTSETDDEFGFAVAAGDFGGDGFDDFVAGVPGEDVGTIADAGSATVIYGTSTGLHSPGNQVWNQNSTNINDSSESGDVFGLAVAAGDFDGNGFDDFVAGVPGENIGSVVDAGAANVIYGTSTGLHSAGDQFWNQNSTGIEDSSETGDSLGYAVTAGDFGNGPEADLVLGATFETVGTVPYAGAVNVIYGTTTGLHSPSNQFWNQDSTDILDSAEELDEFGFGLSFGPGSGPASKAVRP